MVRVTVVFREVGRLKPDYSLDFDMPQVPAVGDYISVQRPDEPKPYGEDLIVRQVWWRLNSPETRAGHEGPGKVGGVDEVIVECEPAVGPYTSDQSRDYLEKAYAGRGLEVPRLKVARLSVRQDGRDPSE